MTDDCQPVITTITDDNNNNDNNRRRCDANIVPGDCWQRSDHHNYWGGHRDTNISGNIRAQFATQPATWQQGDISGRCRPSGRCLQGEHTYSYCPT